MYVILTLAAMAIAIVAIPVLIVLFRVVQILAICALGWFLSRPGHKEVPDGNWAP